MTSTVKRGATGHLSITVYPYKLTQRELEARLEPGLTVLPGQYLRFATPEPIFGQVREVRALPPSSPGLMGGYRLMISLLYGTPSLHPQQAILMSAAQMGHEIQRLQEPIAQPLRLSPDFSAELSRLGPLTLIGGDDFVQKYDTLQLLMGAIHPYRRLIILDPLGIFAEEDGFAYWQAGQDVRLSVQAVGSKSFLDAFGELFAPGLREAALRVVADHLPPMHEFMGFQGLLDWYSALNVPLKNLILQNCQMVAKSHVFADTLEQALDWSRTAAQSVTVLNLSALSEPWRGLFYREAVQALLEQSGDEVVPVLIYPENYLPNLSQWIQKADESEFKLIMLASPYVSDALQGMANNRFWGEMPGRLSLIGSLTLGLPLTIPMPNRTDPQADVVLELPSGTPAHRVELAPQVNEGSSGFSSFNIAMPDEERSHPVDSQTLPVMEASDVPLHWLGEAAGPQVEETPVMKVQSTPSPSPEPEAEPPTESDLPIGPDMQEESRQVEAKSPPVVDLAAPPSEPAPEFLSASQLSDLLASSSPVRPAEEPLPPIKPVSFSDDDAVVVHVPESVEARAPETLPPMPEPVDLPSEAQEAEPLVAIDPIFTETEDSWQPAEAGEDFEFPLMEPNIQTHPQPEAFAAINETPVLPPFPTPEEYEKEEFHFELNPDDHLGSSSVAEPMSQAVVPSVVPKNPVSQSLDEFASLDLTAQEQPFNFSAAEHADPASVPDLSSDAHLGAEAVIPPVEQSHAGSSNGAGAATAVASQSVTELEEALDIIFPYKGEATPAEVLPVEAYVPPLPQADEPMAIVQKSLEPSVSDVASFHAGDRVTHPTYGMGVVQKVIPMEESIVLNITFDAVGKRLLDPSLCDLTREAVK